MIQPSKITILIELPDKIPPTYNNLITVATIHRDDEKDVHYTIIPRQGVEPPDGMWEIVTPYQRPTYAPTFMEAIVKVRLQLLKDLYRYI